MNADNIAIKIRELRVQSQLTQAYMAGELGISQNAYSKIEIGSTRMTLERLFEIAQILNIKVIDLFKDS